MNMNPNRHHVRLEAIVTGLLMIPTLAWATIITEYPVPTIGSEPTGIAAGPDGNLWFTELVGQIGKITPAGTVTEYPIPTAASVPTSITAGSDGNLWFVEQAANQVGKITPSGTVSEYRIPTANSTPNGIAAGSDGNIWFTESRANQVGRITPTGIVTEYPIPYPVGAESPELGGITPGPDGNLWFTSTWITCTFDGSENVCTVAGSIGKITPAGSVTEYPLPTAGVVPTVIAGGPDGNLWFVEALEQQCDNEAVCVDQVGKITPTGTLTEYSLRAEYPLPAGSSLLLGAIASGPDGNLWFTGSYDAGHDQVGKITPTGDVTEYPLPTAYSNPIQVTAGPDRNVWFTEQNTSRIGKVALTLPSCAGDCNGDGQVTVDELLASVNIVLGNTPPAACLHGIPGGTPVDVALILQDVQNSLNGCPAL